MAAASERDARLDDLVKKCRQCGASRPATSAFFGLSKACRGGLRGTCRVCVREKNTAWKRENKKSVNAKRSASYKLDPHKANAQLARWRTANPAAYRALVLRSSMKQRAKVLGLSFDENITHAYLKELLETQKNCACCARVLVLNYKKTGRQAQDAPSIDRFDNSKGYTLKNITLLCWRCNCLKRDASLEELEALVVWMRKAHSV